MSINSRHPPSAEEAGFGDFCIKVNLGKRGNYKAVEMCDKSVYELAQHYYTVEKIATHFGVSAETVLTHHGEAFRAGKLNCHMMPRFLMRRYFEELAEKKSLINPEVIMVGDQPTLVKPDVSGMKGMIELHAKMYEGLGQVQELEIKEADGSHDPREVVVVRPTKEDM